MKRQDILDLALSQVGYKESGTNWTIYARDLDNADYYKPQKKQGVAWCSTFVNWLFFNQLGSAEKAQDILYQPHKNNLSASAAYSASYFKNAHAWYTMPETGDAVYFKNSNGAISHIGIVYQVLGTTIVTIEGNHNNRVEKVTRKRSECVGFGRPNWNKYENFGKPGTIIGGNFEVKCRVIKYVKSNLMKGEDVRSIQKIIGADADGVFGPASEKALKAWQKAHNLEADGKAGPATMTKMFEH